MKQLKNKTKRIISIIIILSSIISFSQNIFVSPRGNDSDKGSKKHPLRTIDKALELALVYKNKGDKNPITLYFREGTYPIKKTIYINKDLENISLYAYNDEKVSFFGGVSIPLSSIKKEKLFTTLFQTEIEVYTVDLKNNEITNYGDIRNVGFARPYGSSWGEIFVNKNEMHLARWPNKGMIPMGKVLNEGSIPRNGDFSNKKGLIAYDSLRISEWAKERNVWMSGYFKWGYADDMVKINKIDKVNKTIETATSTLYGFGNGQPWNQWYGVNILAELDADDEYYIDREKGLLYFISSVSEIKSLDFSILDSPFLVIDGAKNINIEGITFECSRDIGISLSETENVIIKDCIFKNLGSLGITIGKGIEPFADYSHEGTGIVKTGILGSLMQHFYTNTTFNRDGGKNNKIINCQFYQLGAGGVSIGGGNRLTLEAGNNIIENSVFHDLNRLEKSYRPAVHLTGVGNKILHCEIYNTPSMAIYIYGNNHLIEYNYLHEVCLEAEDQGAIYYGRDPSECGTIIRHNYFENIPDHYRTCAVYHDDGAGGMTVTGNIFYKAGYWNVLIGGGSNNIYSNNIFIGNKFGIHIDNRMQNWAKNQLNKGGIFEKRLNAVNYEKPPYSVQYPQLPGYFDKNPSLPKNNIIENNTFVQVKTLLDGKKEWLDYRDNNWETNINIGLDDQNNKTEYFIKLQSAISEKVPEFKKINFKKIGLKCE